MFILENPYVSELLKNTIEKKNYDVVLNDISSELGFSEDVFLRNDEESINNYCDKKVLYTNSENSIEWIVENLSTSEIVKHIDIFKNKFRFRELIQSIYPDFQFREISLDELDTIDISKYKKPFIIKPKYGFLSIGVYTIYNNDNWLEAVKEIKENTESHGSLFPKEVISPNNYIIEEFIQGTEYAVDAYYDKEGEPVVINILEHKFSSSDDVSDRLYITSKKIIEENIQDITAFLKKIGDILNIKSFPLHVEVRIHNNQLIPIEINPMRFAGWCTTDIVYYAYGINPYEYFIEQKKPVWKNILKDKEGKIYSVIILDKPKDINTNDIKRFDYDSVISRFNNVMECRKTDIKKYPIFGMLFTETPDDNDNELEEILTNNLKKFISI
ncbi:MAG: ATP-grasp domain-containing protein [Bacteroidales bacterium]